MIVIPAPYLRFGSVLIAKEQLATITSVTA